MGIYSAGIKKGVYRNYIRTMQRLCGDYMGATGSCAPCQIARLRHQAQKNMNSAKLKAHRLTDTHNSQLRQPINRIWVVPKIRVPIFATP